jgi:hypothetical protein
MSQSNYWLKTYLSSQNKEINYSFQILWIYISSPVFPSINLCPPNSIYLLFFTNLIFMIRKVINYIVSVVFYTFMPGNNYPGFKDFSHNSRKNNLIFPEKTEDYFSHNDLFSEKIHNYFLHKGPLSKQIGECLLNNALIMHKIYDYFSHNDLFTKKIWDYFSYKGILREKIYHYFSIKGLFREKIYHYFSHKGLFKFVSRLTTIFKFQFIDPFVICISMTYVLIISKKHLRIILKKASWINHQINLKISNIFAKKYCKNEDSCFTMKFALMRSEIIEKGVDFLQWSVFFLLIFKFIKNEFKKLFIRLEAQAGTGYACNPQELR